jgi:hypothetical protein
MAIDERTRHDLYVALEQLMGTERADSLMGLLPPVGWADVATKHDLTELEGRMNLRFEKVDLRFDKLEARFDAKLERELRNQMRTLFFGLLTALFTMASICIAAIALVR